MFRNIVYSVCCVGVLLLLTTSVGMQNSNMDCASEKEIRIKMLAIQAAQEYSGVDKITELVDFLCTSWVTYSQAVLASRIFNDSLIEDDQGVTCSEGCKKSRLLNHIVLDKQVSFQKQAASYWHLYRNGAYDCIPSLQELL